MNHLHTSRAAGGAGQLAFSIAVLLIVIGLTLLTAIAIIGLQIEVYADQAWLAAFYGTLFCILLAFEVTGFTLLAQRFRAGAWGKGAVILVIWLIAVPFVSYQEWRFHKLHDVTVEQEAASADAQAAYRAERLAVLEARLAILGDQRSVSQVDGDLARFIGVPPDRLSVAAQRRQAALTAERETAVEAAALRAEQETLQQTTANAAAATVDTRSVFKLGQAFTIPGLNWTVSEDQTLLGLIMLMAGIRSFALWALLGDQAAPAPQGEKRPWRWPWDTPAAPQSTAPPAPLPGHQVRRGRHGWTQVRTEPP